jgi:hypothetical protein
MQDSKGDLLRQNGHGAFVREAILKKKAKKQGPIPCNHNQELDTGGGGALLLQYDLSEQLVIPQL